MRPPALLPGQGELDALLDDGLTSADWIRAAVLLVVAVLAAVAVARLGRRLIGRWVDSAFASQIAARLAAYATFLLVFVYALNSLGVRVGPLLGALGLGGLVLALALQKLVENFVAALILQARRPFTIGDTVRLSDQLGVVTDIDARTTVLASLDGTIVRIPNATVVAETIENLTRNPHRRSRLGVGVAYDTDLDIAIEALFDALARVPSVRDEPAPQVTLTRFGPSSIDFDVFYWHDSDVPTELSTRHDVIRSVHRALLDRSVTIAFPQMVVWPGEKRPTPVYEAGETPEFAQRAASDAERRGVVRRRVSTWRRQSPRSG